MIDGFHTEVLMAAGYAVFLVLVALMLEWLAKHSHRHSEQLRVTGFKFHKQLDHWECPTGELLRRHSTDHQRNVVLYRAPGHVCNCCHKKSDCTDSDDGREIEHRVDSWVQSEIRRYHRGISLVLLLLAALILAAQLLWFKQPRDLMLLGIPLAAIGAAGTRMLAGFRSKEVKI
ncbi:MAG: hypothetical protein EPN47_10970 [Acidobacteria bacterium]|nr:MAG: hypothetical protein EPN47_10970 [Acidobacteriota bacterium]